VERGGFELGFGEVVAGVGDKDEKYWRLAN
jgi:hypothetical protein